MGRERVQDAQDPPRRKKGASSWPQAPLPKSHLGLARWDEDSPGPPPACGVPPAWLRPWLLCPRWVAGHGGPLRLPVLPHHPLQHQQHQHQPGAVMHPSAVRAGSVRARLHACMHALITRTRRHIPARVPRGRGAEGWVAVTRRCCWCCVNAGCVRCLCPLHARHLPPHTYHAQPKSARSLASTPSCPMTTTPSPSAR